MHAGISGEMRLSGRMGCHLVVWLVINVDRKDVDCVFDGWDTCTTVLSRQILSSIDPNGLTRTKNSSRANVSGCHLHVH